MAETSRIMTVDELLRDAGDLMAPAGPLAKGAVSSIEYDSRRAGRDSLFVAIEGFQSDGHRYVREVVQKGAKGVVVARKRLAEFQDLSGQGVMVLSSDNPRRALSRLSAAFYRRPSSRVMAVGITGTNGKTSITYMLEAICRKAGRESGVIGTVNYRWRGQEMPSPNTTPESRDLQELMSRMAEDGVEVIIMEVSSHGLELGRADDIDFDVALFTNLTRDHLDFHHDFESYYQAKKRLFALIGAGSKPGRAALVNIDDSYGRRLVEERGEFACPLYTFGIEGEADYRPLPGSVRSSLEGISYSLERGVPGMEIRLALAGGFNVYNSLSAVAAAHRLGMSPEAIAAGLREMQTVPGRFDRILSEEGFYVIVDYAHTDDALLKLLKSVRDLAPHRVITLFGCGGDRDRSKRPVMGRIASEYSDHVIVTSDNPRTEEPCAIIRDILGGMNGTNHEVIEDRAEAIARGIAMARKGDVVVIAGKGHEDYQIIGKTRIHFDDRELARDCISRRRPA